MADDLEEAIRKQELRLGFRNAQGASTVQNVVGQNTSNAAIQAQPIAAPAIPTPGAPAEVQGSSAGSSRFSNLSNDQLQQRIRAAEVRAKLESRPTKADAGSAAVRSVFQGLSLNTFDDLADGVRAVFQQLSDAPEGVLGPQEKDFLERFKDLRGASKERAAAEREQFPNLTTGLNIAGSLATGVIAPQFAGPKIASGIKALAPAISSRVAGGLGQLTAATGAAAVVGAGQSQSDTLSGVFADAARAAPLGVAGFGAGKVLEKIAPPVAKALGSAGRKSLTVLARIPENHAKRYLQRAAAMNGAPKIGDFAGQVADASKALADRVVSGSQAATKLIPSSLSFPREQIIKAFKDQISKLKGRRSDQHAQAVDELERFISRGSQEGDIVVSELKNILIDLSLSIKPRQNEVFNPISSSAKLKIYNELNGILRPVAPAYAKAMEDVALDRDALGRVLNSSGKALFPDENIGLAVRRIKTAGKDDVGGIEIVGLNALDSRLGTTFAETSRDLHALKSFSGDKTRGSRLVNLLGIMGMAISHPIAALGAGFGAITDMFGGQMGKLVLDAFRGGQVAKSTKVGQWLQKYGPTLAKAKTPEGLAITNAVLFENNNDYRDLIDSLIGEDGSFQDIPEAQQTPSFDTTGSLDTQRQGGLGSLIQRSQGQGQTQSPGQPKQIIRNTNSGSRLNRRVTRESNTGETGGKRVIRKTGSE